MGEQSATAIVLAGGRSSRFGAEKMAADLDGRPLLHHAILAVSAVCSEVLVVGAPTGLPVELPDGLHDAPLVLLDDEPYEGPLVALANAAHSATMDRLLIVGGDMPGLQPAILQRLLSWGPGADGACLVVDDWPQPFPMGLARSASMAAASSLIASGERRIRRLIPRLAVDLVPEQDWRLLDPAAQSLRDIDRPEDLASRAPRTDR